jgi:hypothetical protein
MEKMTFFHNLGGFTVPWEKDRGCNKYGLIRASSQNMPDMKRYKFLLPVLLIPGNLNDSMDRYSPDLKAHAIALQPKTFTCNVEFKDFIDSLGLIKVYKELCAKFGRSDISLIRVWEKYSNFRTRVGNALYQYFPAMLFNDCF